MDTTRREIVTGLSAFALLATLAEATVADGQAPAASLKLSTVFAYDKLPVKTYANGGTGCQVMAGTLPTGEFVEVHETMLPAGQMPHPPHRHSHSELLLIRTGTLEFLDEGMSMPAGPGDVVFTASNRLHGLKNVGATPATYFVVAVGVQKAEA